MGHSEPGCDYSRSKLLQSPAAGLSLAVCGKNFEIAKCEAKCPPDRGKVLPRFISKSLP